MKYSLYYIIGVIVLVLFSACGQRQTSIGLVKDFIKENAVAPEKMEHRDFGKLGTTNRLSDSLVAEIQQRRNAFYKQDILYPTYQSGASLYFIRMNFVCEGDTFSHTFYIDEQLERVVAVK